LDSQHTVSSSTANRSVMNCLFFVGKRFYYIRSSINIVITIIVIIKADDNVHAYIHDDEFDWIPARLVGQNPNNNAHTVTVNVFHYYAQTLVCETLWFGTKSHNHPLLAPLQKRRILYRSTPYLQTLQFVLQRPCFGGYGSKHRRVGRVRFLKDRDH
jgi:hypothetical protein